MKVLTLAIPHEFEPTLAPPSTPSARRASRVGGACVSLARVGWVSARSSKRKISAQTSHTWHQVNQQIDLQCQTPVWGSYHPNGGSPTYTSSATSDRLSSFVESPSRGSGTPIAIGGAPGGCTTTPPTIPVVPATVWLAVIAALLILANSLSASLTAASRISSPGPVSSPAPP